MNEATTQAGRALLEDYPGLLGLEYGRTGEPIVLAIEQEAVAKYRRDIDALRKPPAHGSGNWALGWNDALAAVLALLGEPNDD